VIFEKEGEIAHVTLNRPRRANLYNVQMRDDLYEVLTAVRDDPGVRAVIFSGAGDGFCGGADLTEFGTAPSPTIARDVRWARDVWGVLKDMDKLTVAAMHGYALGSGLEMALLCDLRLAAEGTRFGLPEVGLGLIPAAGGTQGAARVAKLGTALAMVLTGARMDAWDAYRIGLVHRVVPREALPAEAETMVHRVLSAGPAALVLAKAAVNGGMDLTLEQGLHLEERLNDLAYRTRDAWEGIRAAAEGCAPVFRGR